MGTILFWFSCILLPALLRGASPSAAAAVADGLLSLDVPLTLVLALRVVFDARSIQQQRGSTLWLWPRALEPARVRWHHRLRWCGLLRWPGGFALAGVALAAGNGAVPSGPDEMLLSACIAWLLGIATAFALRDPALPRHGGTGLRPRAGRGLKALGVVPFREVREYVDLRRLMLLAVPAMLAAPVGASAGMVGAGLLLWLPLMLLVLVLREALTVDREMRRWLAQAPIAAARLSMFAWRDVVLLFATVGALAMFYKGTGP